jgi:hypothetical protein
LQGTGWREDVERKGRFLVRFGQLAGLGLAGLAAFGFTPDLAFLMLRDFGEQVMASTAIGLFALAVVWLAYERPNSAQARASAPSSTAFSPSALAI